MRIYGLMVTRNEADRYLHSSISWLKTQVDEVFVYDDRSTDGTIGVARDAGAHVEIRPLDDPSFLDDESLFRQASWDALGAHGDLTTDDWVVIVDADEFLVGEVDLRTMLAENPTYGIQVKVNEVFLGSEDVLYIRTDGSWGNIWTVPFIRYTSERKIRQVGLGCTRGPLPEEGLIVDDPSILHFGYLQKQDREEKYSRYSGRRGHNPRHIRSILTPGIHEEWKGQVPWVN